MMASLSGRLEEIVGVASECLLLVFRLRQLRVTNSSCTIYKDFQNAIKQCYADYDPSLEDTAPFGNGFREFSSADA